MVAALFAHQMLLNDDIAIRKMKLLFYVRDINSLSFGLLGDLILGALLINVKSNMIVFD